MRKPPTRIVVSLLRTALVLAALVAFALQRWSLGFVALATLAAVLAPDVLASRYKLRLPTAFIGFTIFFVVATLFLGEVLDFYNRYWWWDIALHGMSAIGFGIVGFLFIFYMFEGDRYAAPAWAVAFFSWCFAVAIGAAWEIFEFTMDSLFGTNMLKSGLPDTMGDLIVDMIGAALGAFSGYLYLFGQERGGLFAWLIHDFVRNNPQYFRRLRQELKQRFDRDEK